MSNHEVFRFLSAALELYIQTSRSTGRTSMMLRSARSGDVVIAATSDHARHLRNFLQAAGIKGVNVIICPVDVPDELYRAHTNVREGGAMHVDHTWIEIFYLHQLSRLRRVLETFVTPGAPLYPDPTPPHWSEALSHFHLTRRKARDTDLL